MPSEDHDFRVRRAAFEFLRAQTELLGDVLPWAVLQRGFDFEGRRVPLVSQQGIFKPAILDLPISIRTTPPPLEGPRPYDDQIDASGRILYRYRGTDARHPENQGLRRAMTTRTPLVYAFGITEGRYLPLWPVFIVGDDPSALAFRIEADDPLPSERAGDAPEPDAESEGRRRYVTVTALRRLHQVRFRQQVLTAYATSCAVCRLRHDDLLDAAHILPDGHPRGLPIVPNGISLCKLHHAAFDRNILGVHPDLHVEIRTDVLEEEDGPMLLHGLKGFHGARITVPRRQPLQPRAEFLEERYDAFRRA